MLMRGLETELSPLTEGSLICAAFRSHYCQKAIKAWLWLVLYTCVAFSSQHYHSALVAYHFLLVLVPIEGRFMDSVDDTPSSRTNFRRSQGDHLWEPRNPIIRIQEA